MNHLRDLALAAQKVAAPEWMQEQYEDGDSEGGGYGVMLPGSMVWGFDLNDRDGPYDEFDVGNPALAAYFVRLHPARFLKILDELEALRARVYGFDPPGGTNVQ